MCIYPVIKTAIEQNLVTIESIAKAVNEDSECIKNKLCGKEKFDINEAMIINMEFFSDIPFKDLFYKVE